MNQLSLWINFILSVMTMDVYGLTTDLAQMDKPTKCTLERSYKMIGYNCADLNLKDIPQYLKSNVEVSILELFVNSLSHGTERQLFN